MKGENSAMYRKPLVVVVSLLNTLVTDQLTL